MRRIYGIDFKNPFTMSNTRSVLLNFRRSGTVSLHHLDIFGRAFALSRTRQSQLSCALWARFAALADLGRVRCSFATASFFLRFGGAYRDRTDDLMLAKQPLSQLS